jgi:hypothetical protein
MEQKSIEQSTIWNNGLCREFTKAVCDIIEDHKISSDEYDLEYIAHEVIKLRKEIFRSD